MTARLWLTATSIGDGVRPGTQLADLSETGNVVGTFSSGFYVRVIDRLFAVGGPMISAGPIHLVLEAAPPAPTNGSIVNIHQDHLQTDSFAIDLSRAVLHRPPQPSLGQLQTIAPILARLDRLAARLGDVAHVWDAVGIATRRSDLHAARRLLEGLGGGLTPTGDDVLAGLVMFARWSDPSSTVPAEVARLAATTHLSRCFLTWAAAGQSIQPIHDLLIAAEKLAQCKGAAAGSAAQERFDRAAAVVASIGASSGSGVLAGLGLAARTWVRRQRDAMAASG